jgi:hypothetical protein
MNGDTHRPEVAAAQIYFASIADVIRQLHVNSDNVAQYKFEMFFHKKNDRSAAWQRLLG